MPSLQSHLFIFALKQRHLLRSQLKRRATIDWNTSIPRLRQEIEKSAGFFGKLPSQIEVSPITIEGLSAEWILHSQAKKDKVILYVHGGGYVTGSCQGHRALVAKFVKGFEVGALLWQLIAGCWPKVFRIPISYLLGIPQAEVYV